MEKHDYNIAVKEHSNALYSFAVHFLRNKEDARDIVQDSFEKLWLNCEKVEHSKAKSWLFTCTYNAMVNFVSRSNRIVLTETSKLPESLDKSHSQFESQQVVDRIVSILPPLQKSIILLRDLEGYSYDEIGEILDLSSSQIKVYLFRARNKVKKQLQHLNIIQ